ncbi:MAG: TonB-dependent receptor [Halieaceae bacterium]|jgi:iron complex outermembrane receptor protein|nr:TonB-dependent receptor [Halieaceae bacterium]
MRFVFVALWSVITCTLAALNSAAETRSIEEVFVRAQQRETRLLDTPLTVSVFDADFLKQNRLQRLESIVLATPNFSGWEQGVSTPIFALRGISSNSFGIGGEASVGFFVDDTYRGRINSTAITLVDVEQVEVLKGPQGTLFGRNTSAGAILVRHFEPSEERSLEVQLEAGENDYAGGYVTANLPLSPRWALRGSLFSYDDEGDADNIVADTPIGDRDTRGAQFGLAYRGEDFDALLRGSWQETRTGGLGYETLDPELAARGGVRANPFDSVVATDIDTFDDIESGDLSLRLVWTLAEGLKLTSITAWHENDSPNNFDVDGSAVFLTSASFAARNSETWSQELRLNGQRGDFDWVLGAIVFDESIDTVIELGYSDTNLLAGTPLCSAAFVPVFGDCQPAVLETALQQGDYFSAGVYGDINWQVSSQLSLGVGLRYSYDDKRFDYRADPVTSVVAGLAATPLNPSGNLLGYATDGVESLDHRWDNWQPRLYANWQFAAQHSLFANVAKGYKAGGFDPEATRGLSRFDAEQVWSVDAGLRGSNSSRNLNYQLSAFVYDYDDYQVQIIDNGIAQTGNVAGLDGRGLELELSWTPLPDLVLAVNAAWLDAEFKPTLTDTGDLGGNRPVVSPEYSTSISAGWRSPQWSWGSIGVNWLSAWQDEVFFSVQNDPDASQASYWRHDARLSWYAAGNGRWRVDLFGRNLSNEDYVIFQDNVGAGSVSRRGEPRFLGAAVNYAL